MRCQTKGYKKYSHTGHPLVWEKPFLRVDQESLRRYKKCRHSLLTWTKYVLLLTIIWQVCNQAGQFTTLSQVLRDLCIQLNSPQCALAKLPDELKIMTNTYSIWDKWFWHIAWRWAIAFCHQGLFLWWKFTSHTSIGVLTLEDAQYLIQRESLEK